MTRVAGVAAATVRAVALVLLFAAPLAAQSSIRTDVDTTLVTVGDLVTMTVSVEHEAGAAVVWPDSIDLAPFEVLEARTRPAEADGDRARSTAVFSLAAFELGELVIPSFDVLVVAPDGSAETLSTDEYGVEVVTVGEDETGDIRDIRGPLGIPISAVRVAFLGVLLLIVGLLAYAGLRRRGPVADRPAPGPPPRPAHEVALEALARIESSPMLERGQVKEYHIEISDVLRRYVEARFGVTALEMTTWEIIEGLERVQVDPGFREGLRRFLDQCDMVKFAKVRPDADASREALALGRELVEDSIAPAAKTPSAESHASETSVAETAATVAHGEAGDPEGPRGEPS
jgi:hypothetical protein